MQIALRLVHAFSVCSLLATGFLIADDSISDDGENDVNGGVVITFDDKEIGNWHSALTKRPKLKATLYIYDTDDLTEKQYRLLKELQKDGHEIGFHTKDHPNLKEYLETDSLSHYMKEQVRRPLKKFRERGFKVKSFAYPYGVGLARADSLLADEFSTVRYTDYDYSEDSFLYQPGTDRLRLNGLSADGKFGLNRFRIEDILDRAKSQNKVALFYTHGVGSGGLQIRPETLDFLVEETKKRNLEFCTVREMTEGCGAN